MVAKSDSDANSDLENSEDSLLEGLDGTEQETSSEIRKLIVPADLYGYRLDKTLALLVPEFSRNYHQYIIKHGCVHVNDAKAKRPGQKICAGDWIVVELKPTPLTLAFTPQPMDLPIVYEDEHILIINKPVGLVVHPAPGNWSGTLVNGLLARDDRAIQLPRAGIVHRLDKNTSGLMVVARTRPAMDKLIGLIAKRVVHREYVAIAHNQWSDENQIVVDQPIGRDPRNRIRMAVITNGLTASKPAKTHITLLVNNAEKNVCLVRCVLDTGRTHQIRVHMSYIGHPLIADTTYGGVAFAGLERQALHARRLAFAHPITREELSFESTPPLDLQQAMEQLAIDTIAA